MKGHFKFEGDFPPPWVGGPGGKGRGPWGAMGHQAWHGGPPWAGGRRRRGDIRAALLAALLEGPAHGYELITRLEQRSGGMWRPSPGSVYPTLQLLEEQGLITGHDAGGKRVFDLTDEGRTAAAEGIGDRQPWDVDEPGGHRDLRVAIRTLMLAARQVAIAGDESQVAAATEIITDARQRIYRLLAGEHA